MSGMAGVEIGIVRSLEDPGGEGRIQVQFPGIKGAPNSNWAAMAVPLAGNQRGMFFMPEIGDEVLVAFYRGDFASPYIVGSLWNGSDRPPERDPQNRIIVTPGGHQLRFEDGKRIVIHSAGGSEIVLDDAASSIELKGGGRSLKLIGGEVQIT